MNLNPRDVRGIVADVVDRLVAWCDTTDDGVDDGASVEADEGERRQVTVLSPPGVYAVAAKGVRALLLRLLDGGAMLGAYTAPPSGSEAGETGFYVGGSSVRMKPNGDVRIESASGAKVTVDGTTGTVVITGVDSTESRGAAVTLGADGLAIKSITRADDNCERTGAMLAWMTAVNTAIGLILGAVPPGIGPDNISITVSASQHKASL